MENTRRAETNIFKVYFFQLRCNRDCLLLLFSSKLFLGLFSKRFQMTFKHTFGHRSFWNKTCINTVHIFQVLNTIFKKMYCVQKKIMQNETWILSSLHIRLNPHSVHFFKVNNGNINKMRIIYEVVHLVSVLLTLRFQTLFYCFFC